MVDQINLKRFNDIYNETYDSVIKYIMCKCRNIDDINDIVQDTYVELYKNLLKNTPIKNINHYIIGIAKNKIKNYYSILYKIRTISLFSKNEMDIEIKDTIADKIDIEKIIIENADIDAIWDFLKSKNLVIIKIFYLYYVQSYTIKEISQELEINESTIKNHLYRTLKELQNIYKGE